MPSCTTHFLQAKRVYDLLPENIRQGMNRPAYYWAAQGPDFFFCDRYFPWMRGNSISRFGTALHNVQPSAIFESMREYGKIHNDPVLRSYLLGFVNHYTMDSTAHPYVNILAAELLEDRPEETMTTMHGEIESALDTIMLRRETGKITTQISLKKFFPRDAAVFQMMCQLYSQVIEDVFGETVKPQDILRAIQDTRTVYGWLTDSTTLKKKIVERFERGKPHLISSHLLPLIENPGIDYANTGNSPWKNHGQKDTRDFFELFDAAVERSLEIISGYDTCDFKEKTVNLFSGDDIPGSGETNL